MKKLIPFVLIALGLAFMAVALIGLATGCVAVDDAAAPDDEVVDVEAEPAGAAPDRPIAICDPVGHYTVAAGAVLEGDCPTDVGVLPFEITESWHIGSDVPLVGGVLRSGGDRCPAADLWRAAPYGSCTQQIHIAISTGASPTGLVEMEMFCPDAGGYRCGARYNAVVEAAP